MVVILELECYLVNQDLDFAMTRSLSVEFDGLKGFCTHNTRHRIEHIPHMPLCKQQEVVDM